MKNVIFLIAIISISLLAFQTQNAFAAAPVLDTDQKTLSTTTILVCFTNGDLDPATTDAADFTYDPAGGTAFVAVTSIADSQLNANCSGGAGDGVILTVPAFATDATPSFRVTADSVSDGVNTGPAAGAANTDRTAADGVAPTFDSAATVTTTSITATFSESINAGSVVAGDFTISDGITVNSVSVNGAVVTLTTSEFGADDTPTVTIVGNIDDAAAATNNIAAGNNVASDGNVKHPGTSGGTDSSAPSIGSTGFNGISTIDNGFSYNFNPTDVDGWKTDYPLIRTPVGAMNTLDLKVMENKGLGNIYFVSVNFGASQVGKAGEAIVTYYPNQAEKIKIIDPNNLLGEVDFKINPTKCKANSTTESCFKFTLEHTFNEAPIHDVVGIAVADMSRNVGYAYFNHGVEVYGDSLNPPLTETITNTYEKHSQQITLTQTDRELDLWEDENKNQWTRNIMGSWIKITQETYIVPDDNAISPNGMKRINQHFAKYMSEQESLSKQIWDGSQIQSSIPDTIESNPTEKMMSINDSELKLKILNEIEDAKIHWDSDTIQNDISDYFEYDLSDEILRADNMKLQESKSLESDKAKELLYKMYGKW